MKKYTIGLVFTDDLKKIALIRKRKPQWQSGCLNGVGGKVEENETFEECIIRETEEEFGVHIPSWQQLTTMVYEHNDGFEIGVFRTKVSEVLFNNISSVTDTDEDVVILNVDEIHKDEHPLINNLRWLISMAIWETPASNIVLQSCNQGSKWIDGFDFENL